MALSLKDLNKNKKEKINPIPLMKGDTLRPWESFDQLEDQTRTFSAKVAVNKAREKYSKESEKELIAVNEINHDIFLTKSEPFKRAPTIRKIEERKFNKESLPGLFKLLQYLVLSK